MHLVKTTAFYRRDLPHWEIANGRYFVTVRCADSLPRHVVQRLGELQASAKKLATAEEREQAQRLHFKELDAGLDQCFGSCPLRNSRAADIVVREFDALDDWGVDVPHFTVMPNHFHALIEPRVQCIHALSQILKRIKGRTAYQIRDLLGGRGRFWQREWFDRWMRNEVERYKTIAYIKHNPVKAGLARARDAHRWTR